MNLKTRIPMASLLCLALLTACLNSASSDTVTVKLKDEIFPAPGNSCVFSTNPLNNIGELPPTTVQWNFGGDAGVGGSDSRSVYIRAKGDNQELVDHNGKRTDLINGQTYILRVNNFTAPFTGTPPTTRDAKLISQGSPPVDLQLELTTGTDWPIDDFFYTSAPGSNSTVASLTGFLFDVTGGSGTDKDGFCVTFDIEGPLGTGSGTGLEALIQLNPDNNAPGTPQINFSFDFDDLDSVTGMGEIQIDALQATTISTVDFTTDDQGTITVEDMLATAAANGQVTNTSAGTKSPIKMGSLAPGYLPSPDFPVIVMGSLTGSRQSTLRFAPKNGQLIDFSVSQ